MIEIGDVADGQSEDLDLGELLVGRQSWQQLPELSEGHVEGLHADALPGGVCGAVLGGGAAPPPLLLPAERRVRLTLDAAVLTLRGLVGDAARCRLQPAQHALGVGLGPGEVGLSLVRTQHHL